MNEPTHQMTLVIDDCARVTDWMLWVSAASNADRALNTRLCEHCVSYSSGRAVLNLPTTLGLQTPVGDLKFSARVQIVLARERITTLEELLRLTKGDLLAMRHFGKTSLVSVESELARHGLYLGMLRTSPTVHLTLDDARRVLGWYQMVSPSFRTPDDRRIARSLAMFLHLPIADDELADSLSREFDLDIDDELAEESWAETEVSEIEPDVEDESAFGAAEDDEIADVAGEPWKSADAWKPDDPDSWKANDFRDADFWKPDPTDDMDEDWRSDDD